MFFAIFWRLHHEISKWKLSKKSFSSSHSVSMLRHRATMECNTSNKRVQWLSFEIKVGQIWYFCSLPPFLCFSSISKSQVVIRRRTSHSLLLPPPPPPPLPTSPSPHPPSSSSPPLKPFPTPISSKTLLQIWSYEVKKQYFMVTRTC